MFFIVVIIFTIAAIPATHAQLCPRPSAANTVSAMNEASADGGITFTAVDSNTQNFAMNHTLRITCMNLSVYRQATCQSDGNWNRPFNFNCNSESSFAGYTMKPAYVWPLNRISGRNGTVPGLPVPFSGGQLSANAGPFRNLSETSYYVNGAASVVMTANIAPATAGGRFTLSFYFKHMSKNLTNDFFAINYAAANNFIGFRTSNVTGQFIFKAFDDSFTFSTNCGDAYNRWIFWTITYANPGLYAWCDDTEAYNNASVSVAFILPNTSAVLSLGKNTINSGANEGAISCLSIYWGIVNSAEDRKSLRHHCEAVSSVEPKKDVPACLSLATAMDCIQIRFQMDKSMSLGNLAHWRLRGGAWLSSNSLAINLMPAGPLQYGSAWAAPGQIYSLSFLATPWRLEIQLTQLVTYGTLGFFIFKDAHLNANIISAGSFQFGFDPSVFVGLAIFIDMDLQRIDVVTSAAANPAWTTIDQMRASPTLSHNLDCSPKAPFDKIVLEHILLAFTVVTHNTETSISSAVFQTSQLFDLFNFGLDGGDGLLGVGMYSGANTPSSFDGFTEATGLLSMNYYGLTINIMNSQKPATIPICPTPTAVTKTTITTTAMTNTEATTTTPEPTTTNEAVTMPDPMKTTVEASTPDAITTTEATTIPGTKTNTAAITTIASIKTEDTTISQNSNDETTTHTVRIDEFYEVEITFNITFEEDLYLPISQRNISASDVMPFDGLEILADQNSPLFKELENLLKPPICELYANLWLDHSCAILRFRRGSIVADYIVALKSLTQLSDAEIEEKVQQVFGMAKQNPRSVLKGVTSIYIIKSKLLAVRGQKSTTSKVITVKSSDATSKFALPFAKFGIILLIFHPLFMKHV